MASAIEVASLFGVLALQDRMSPGLRDAERNARGFGGVLGGLTSTIVGVGQAALVAGGVAATAFGALVNTGVNEFATLERGMNEVFTLMPGASEQAMDDMTLQVRRFSQVFGTLPEEVVPALYQSLSAGVPQDNVFNFLEIAQKAAIGGVTELETAVDGISSVVNAYGSDVIDAGRASDLMFTTVRLGKTDFEQLSQSLFNVIPTASSLGVSFEDVSAGLATITAAGTPTSVATTQMRQLFVELGDTGTGVGKTFQELSGKSFKEFIAEGNNVADALAILQGHADESNVDLNQLFGSVEAGNAALGLTGPNADRFTSSIEEMGNATGATDAAFETMNQGLSRSREEFAASFSVMAGTLGELFAPAFIAVTDTATTFMNVIQNGLDGEPLSDWIGDLPGWLQPVGEWVGRVSFQFRNFMTGLQEGMPGVVDVVQNRALPVLQTFFGWIGQAWEIVQPGLSAFSAWFTESALPTAISFVRDTGQVVIEAFFNHIMRVWDTVSPALTAFGNWFMADGLPGIVSFIQDTALPLAQDFFNFLGEAWELISPALGNVYNWFFEDALPGIFGFIQDDVYPLILTFFDTIANLWELVSPALESFGNWFLESGLPAVIDFIGGRATDVINTFVGIIQGVSNAVGSAMNDINNMIDAAQEGGVGGVLNQGRSNIGSFFSSVGGALFGGSRDSGGGAMAGRSYAIGQGAQPELFTAPANGQFVPNIDKVIERGIAAGQSGNGGQPVTINVYQLPGEDGEMFADRVATKVRNRGMVMG